MIRRSVIIGLLLVIAMVSRATAQQLLTKQVNLVEMTDHSGYILHGRILDCRQEADPQYANITVRTVRMAVMTNVRGGSGRVFMFHEYVERPRIRRFDKTEPAARGKTTDRKYRPGEELVLFLYRESKYGLTSPVGAQQGTFRVVRNRAGQAWAANAINNAGLFQDVAGAAQQSGMKLSAAEQGIAASGAGPVELKSFLSLVNRFASRRTK